MLAHFRRFSIVGAFRRMLAHVGACRRITDFCNIVGALRAHFNLRRMLAHVGACRRMLDFSNIVGAITAHVLTSSAHYGALRTVMRYNTR
jgi:hypothetical protein